MFAFFFKRNHAFDTEKQPFLLKERAVSLMLKDRVLNVYVLFILF